jgi:hypothetical protein
MKHAIKWSAQCSIVTILLGGCLLGCETKVNIPHKQWTPDSTVSTSRVESTASLVTEVSPFDADIQRLPGTSAQEHRQVLVSLLDRLPRMLELANGSVESPQFSNSIWVIKSAHDTVNDPDVDRRRMEAAENQALHATASAGGEITSRYLWDDDQLPPLLQNLTDYVTVADQSVGPMHDLDASNAFVAVQAVTDRIAYDLNERFPAQAVTVEPAPAIAPTPAPATAPASAPAMTP